MTEPADRIHRLRQRSAVLHAIRDWFHRQNFIEVETPVRVSTPALELHIDAVPSAPAYLRTSPELHMKRLLAEGLDRMYQLGPCFRAGESGPLHHPEYGMLEWYRAGADYLDILADTRALLQHVWRSVTGTDRFLYQGRSVDLAGDWEVIPVRDAFLQHAGWDPVGDYDADRFDLDLIDRVEPALPHDRPVILIDYPAAAAALSRRKPEDPRLAERWELYIAGIELANAYSELTDPVEQRRRFEACAAERRELGKPVYSLDEAFLQALARGLPECGGIALGVDRLVLLLCDATDLGDVTAFQEPIRP